MTNCPEYRELISSWSTSGVERNEPLIRTSTRPVFVRAQSTNDSTLEVLETSKGLK